MRGTKALGAVSGYRGYGEENVTVFRVLHACMVQLSLSRVENLLDDNTGRDRYLTGDSATYSW